MTIRRWLQSTPLYDLPGNIYLFTTGMLALYLVFCSGYQYAQKSGQKKQALAIGLTSLLAFFIVTPYTQAGEASSVAQIPVQWLGAQGLFMALVVGVLTGFIFKFCLEHHVEIKLPEQVPPTIARQFSALLPILFVCVFLSLIKCIFSLTPYGDVQNAFYTLLSIPLKAIRASVFGLFFLWVFNVPAVQYGGLRSTRLDLWFPVCGAVHPGLYPLCSALRPAVPGEGTKHCPHRKLNNSPYTNDT